MTSNSGPQGNPQGTVVCPYGEAGTWDEGSLLVPAQDQGCLEAGELAQLWREREGVKDEGLPPQPPHSFPPGPATRTSLVNFIVCRASSRVGERMRARAPVCALCAFSRSNMGRRKQAVFPLPVRAMATTSLPSKITGMVCQKHVGGSVSTGPNIAGHG